MNPGELKWGLPKKWFIYFYFFLRILAVAQYGVANKEQIINLLTFYNQ